MISATDQEHIKHQVHIRFASILFKNKLEKCSIVFLRHILDHLALKVNETKLKTVTELLQSYYSASF